MAENPSHSIDWNVETVKELMNHMAKTGLGELTLEDEDLEQEAGSSKQNDAQEEMPDCLAQ